MGYSTPKHACTWGAAQVSFGAGRVRDPMRPLAPGKGFRSSKIYVFNFFIKNRRTSEHSYATTCLP